jgi:hypothetical protein
MILFTEVRAAILLSEGIPKSNFIGCFLKLVWFNLFNDLFLLWLWAQL